MAPPPPVHPIPCARPAWVFRGNRPSPRPRPSPLAAPSPCGPAVPRTAAHGRLARCVVVGLRRSTVVMPVLRSEEGRSRLAQESARGTIQKGTRVLISLWDSHSETRLSTRVPILYCESACGDPGTECGLCDHDRGAASRGRSGARAGTRPPSLHPCLSSTEQMYWATPGAVTGRV